MTPQNHGSDGIESLIQGLVDTMSDPGDRSIPLATTDATKAIKSQLTENTGRHLLDSGSAYGRNWEENQENPPWGKPRWDVQESYVTENVYHFMEQRLERPRAAVALEAALYGYAYDGPGEGDSWLSCMEGFAEALLDGTLGRAELREYGIEGKLAEDVLGLRHEIDGGKHGATTVNTYNSEWHGLSQCLQYTALGGPYAEYVMVQVHGGCDIRGGYTSPRVYHAREAFHAIELGYYCPECDWSEAESVLGYDDDRLLYQRTLDPGELHDALSESAPDHVSDGDIQDVVNERISEAEERDQSGAVFHIEDGCGGVVYF